MANSQKNDKDTERVWEILRSICTSEYDREFWLNSPHSHLGNRTPQEVIDAGQAGAVVTMLESAVAVLPPIRL
jgi:uncharacterized protein (DUF2384 family)